MKMFCFKWGAIYTDVYVCQKYTEVYILNWYILFYVNYTLRKLISEKGCWSGKEHPN